MIVVSGASGFVGCNLCQRLQGARLSYRALVRSVEKAAARGIPAERCLQADLTEDLSAAFDGAETVVHLAGLVRARRAEDLYRVNGGGTERLVAALARSAPAARLVHVSSLAAAGPSPDGHGTACPPDEARPVSDYGRSKLAGEQAAAQSPNPWLVLRPSVVYGPWDTDVLVLFRMAARGFVPLVAGHARYSLVHVDDLVEAILRAIDSELTGRFLPIVHPSPVAQREWMTGLGRALDRPTRLLPLPRIAGWLSAHGGQAWAALRGRAPLFGLDKWAEVRAGSWVGDPRPARDSLGFDAAVAHDDGFRRTVEWYRSHGWI